VLSNDTGSGKGEDEARSKMGDHDRLQLGEYEDRGSDSPVEPPGNRRRRPSCGPGQRAGCMVADIQLRRPVTLSLSTTTSTWSVRGNSRFVLLDTLGQALTVDEDTETGVVDANGTSVHARRPLRDDAPAAQWKGSKILDGLPRDSSPQGVGWLVVYK
jgi:hypothetical protein